MASKTIPKFFVIYILFYHMVDKVSICIPSTISKFFYFFLLIKDKQFFRFKHTHVPQEYTIHGHLSLSTLSFPYLLDYAFHCNELYYQICMHSTIPSNSVLEYFHINLSYDVYIHFLFIENLHPFQNIQFQHYHSLNCITTHIITSTP